MDFIPELVAFDLDGTLAESKTTMTAEVGAVLSRLMQAMPVAVLSGAAFHQFQKQFLPGLPKNAPLEKLFLFPTNAAACYVYEAGAWKERYDEAFTQEERERILQALTMSLEETGLAEPPPQVWGERIEDRGAQITFSGLGQQAPIAEKKLWDPTREKRKPLWEMLVKRLPDYSIGLNATTSVDITRKGVTKAYGIGQLATLTGIPITQMLYVGDALGEGGNDAVVIPTGIRTQQVSGPDETVKVIEEILSAKK